MNDSFLGDGAITALLEELDAAENASLCAEFYGASVGPAVRLDRLPSGATAFSGFGPLADGVSFKNVLLTINHLNGTVVARYNWGDERCESVDCTLSGGAEARVRALFNVLFVRHDVEVGTIRFERCIRDLK